MSKLIPLFACFVLFFVLATADLKVSNYNLSFTTSTYAQTAPADTDIKQVGNRLRDHLMAVISVIYDTLRIPLSVLAVLVAIGFLLFNRRQGLWYAMGAFGFAFLWAFAPTLVKIISYIGNEGKSINEMIK